MCDFTCIHLKMVSKTEAYNVLICYNKQINTIGHSIQSLRVRVRVTLWLAAYRQSVPLGANPLETHDQQFFSTEHLRS
jgi:hypothetical protein